MEQIIIFTQPDKLEDIETDFRFTDPIMQFKSSSENSSNMITIINEGETIDVAEYLEGNTNYFVYHSKTLENIAYRELLNSTKYKLQDQHTRFQTIIYEELLQIRTTFNDLKFEKLKMRIFNAKLESALDFLHICLNGKPTGNLPNNLLNPKTIQLFENLPNNLSDEKYIPTLTILRDAILEEVGIPS